jgi:hypothetical protein
MSYFEYIDVASVKKEPVYVVKEEPGDSLDLERIKEGVEDDISLQKNYVCHGVIETHRQVVKIMKYVLSLVYCVHIYCLS